MLYVKIENGSVTQVWDKQPPANDPGWKEAVEVRTPIIANRQISSAHRFDLTKTPVQIIYDAVDVPVDLRKAQMKSRIDAQFKNLVDEQTKELSTYNAAVVESARQTALTKKVAIDAASTHDQLDLLV